MNLTVMTLTRNERPERLAACTKSVLETLPAGGRHLVRECLTDFQRTWYETLHCDDYVAVVDDDDKVLPGALSSCLEALEQTGAGIAFTSEVQVDDKGERLHDPDLKKVNARDIAMHPRAIHHLTVYRTSCLIPQVLDIAEREQVGIEWLTSAWCALNYGWVQVPMVGYEWTQHEKCLTNQNRSLWHQAMPKLRAAIMPWTFRLTCPTKT